MGANNASLRHIFSAFSLFMAASLLFFLYSSTREAGFSTEDHFVLDSECGCRRLPNLTVHPTSTCGLLSTARGPEQKLLSYSFFLGNNRDQNTTALCELTSAKNGYLAGVKKNLGLIKQFYPGYLMRVYHNAPLNERWCPIREELCALFCLDDIVLDLCDVGKIASFPNLEKSFGMLWRFAPMADAFVQEWHSRDLDSTMLEREVDAVREWKKTDTGFHVMRDNPYHNTEILGGMFGVRQDTPERKQARLEEFAAIVSQFGPNWSKGMDQVALGRVVAPHAARDSLVHDSYLCKSGLMRGSVPAPWPTRRKHFEEPSVPNFVGNTGDFSITNECPLECRPKEHPDWKTC